MPCWILAAAITINWWRKYLTCIVLMNLTGTSWTVSEEMGYFVRPLVSARTVPWCLARQLDAHNFGYLWYCITDTSSFNCESNDEHGRINNLTYFRILFTVSWWLHSYLEASGRTHVGSVHSISSYWLITCYRMPLDTRLGHLLDHTENT